MGRVRVVPSVGSVPTARALGPPRGSVHTGTTLEDKVSVSLWSKGQTCLLSVTINHSRSLRAGFVSSNATYCMCRWCFFALPSGKWGSGNHSKNTDILATAIADSKSILVLCARSIMSSPAPMKLQEANVLAYKQGKLLGPLQF